MRDCVVFLPAGGADELMGKRGTSAMEDLVTPVPICCLVTKGTVGPGVDRESCLVVAGGARVVFEPMFRVRGTLPWVLLWRTWRGAKGKECGPGVKGFTGLMGRLTIFRMALSSVLPMLML